MTDPTPTRAEAVAHILGLRHMSGDDLHLPSAADFIERLAAENDALRERAEAAEERVSALHSYADEVCAIGNRAIIRAERAEAAAWNDAIEATEGVAMHPLTRAAIRALRRAAPTEGEA